VQCRRVSCDRKGEKEEISVLFHCATNKNKGQKVSSGQTLQRGGLLTFLEQWSIFCLAKFEKRIMWISKGESTMAFLNTLKKKIKIFNKKKNGGPEAIAFSEADLHEHLTREESLTCRENKGRNLVVASTENRFSQDLISYALEMAKRMDYGIIAINAASITQDVTDFFSTTHDKIYAEFKESSVENAESFRAEARGLGLTFAHIVQSSSIDHAIDHIRNECGHIEFVISENREPVNARGGIPKEKRVAQRLCVYSVN